MPDTEKRRAGRTNFCFQRTAIPLITPVADTNPKYYIDQLKIWQSNRVLLNYIVSDAAVNIPIYINKVEYGEDDGTNNVKLSVTVTSYYKKASSVMSRKDVSKETTVKYNINTMSLDIYAINTMGRLLLHPSCLNTTTTARRQESNIMRRLKFLRGQS